LKVLHEYAEQKQRRGRSAPARIATIKMYIDAISKGKKITQELFVGCHRPVEKTNNPTLRVRSYKQKFKFFLNDFFEDNGSKYKYRLALPKKGYHLLLEKNPFYQEEDREGIDLKVSNPPVSNVIDSLTAKDETKEQSPPEDISFTERVILEARYIPFIYLLIVSVVTSIALIVIFIGGLFNTSSTFLAFLIASAIVVLYVSRNLYRLPQWQFIHFFHRFFLRLSDKKIILATYSSPCPACDGKVELTSKFMKDMGYMARCRKNRHRHRFSFDQTSLRGKKL